MKKEYNFKCKKCGHKLTSDGKCLGTNRIFFMCIDNGGCGEALWIDIKERIDQYGGKY